MTEIEVVKVKDDDALARQILADLVSHRKDVGLRQVDVAEKMGIGQPSVSELERGETSPRLSTLSRYAYAVGLELTVEVSGLPVKPEAV